MTRFVLDQYRIVLFLCCILILAGSYFSYSLPVSLLPELKKPEITIYNVWPGALPDEIEQALVEPLENTLDSIPGVQDFSTFIYPEAALTRIYFKYNTDMYQAYMDVLDRVNRVPNRPVTALEPAITNKSATNDLVVADLLLTAKNGEVYSRENVTNIYEQVIYPKVKAIDGVLRIFTHLNSLEKRLVIEFDAHKLSQYKLEFNDLANAIGNVSDRSGGYIELGEKRYSIKYQGQHTIKSLRNLQISQRNGRNIYLNDVAKIKVDFVQHETRNYFNGERSFHFGLVAAPGSNTLNILEDVKEVVDSLNNSTLAESGLQLNLGADNSVPIVQSVSFVSRNLIVGILLSVFLLTLFIRRPVLLVFIASIVPLSMLGTILVMAITGRSINTISLAGIALSTGIILDAAIILVDSILRQRQLGKSSIKAITDGTKEVSKALFTSVITSIIVFLPILFLDTAEGRLFHDLAITISATVFFSLIASLSLLPIMMRVYFKNQTFICNQDGLYLNLATKLSSLTSSKIRQFSIAIIGVMLPIILSIVFLPNIDVLPDPKGHAVSVHLSLHDRLNEKAKEMRFVDPIHDMVQDHIASGQEPQILSYSVGNLREDSLSLRFYAKDHNKINELKVWLEQSFSDGKFYDAYVNIDSLLRFSLSNYQDVEVNILGKDNAHLSELAQKFKQLVEKELPEAYVDFFGGEAKQSERIVFTPKDDVLQRLNLDRNQIGTLTKAISDGVFVGEYFDGAQNLTMQLKSARTEQLSDLLDTPFHFAGYGTLPLSVFVDMSLTSSDERIDRYNGNKSQVLYISPPDDYSIDQLLTVLKQKVEPVLYKDMQEGESVEYNGSASKLKMIVSQLSIQAGIAFLLLAVIISIMLNSFRYAVISLSAMPFTVLGGILAINAINLFSFQSLDVITFIGFIILIGLAVNNSILFVSHFKNGVMAGEQKSKALYDAIAVRSRPILMSTLTSILGVLPLAILPGTGAEIYRGLAAVIAAGMLFNLIITIPLLSSLLMLTTNENKIKSSLSVEPEVISNVA
ncbi:hypothetical protein N473_01335 [Pseudoalteromonas luteoviolacea CPMOR-1]|uniref:Acriflavin resistance protein n=1 Tax=Pseudoalteromonas luteoviolacea CPMOR-1 TaxID=1365248 RepID=A0A167LUL8_9GAMM|nr:efflux RND transporter permease subunit [Pseudoalteromonas luteoviolacea]KZN65245.1 hypothetical protein N473_01335 [Pseudoalteromonas luteoviolacea CPMOR-1]